MLGSPDCEPSRSRTSITLTTRANALIVLTTSQAAPSIRYVSVSGGSDRCENRFEKANTFFLREKLVSLGYSKLEGGDVTGRRRK
jgi:hypothetical protein